MLIEMREGDVPGVRIFNPKGRWRVDLFSVIYEEQEGDVPPSFRLAHGELAVDQKILLFLKAHPGSTKRAIRDGVGGRSTDVDGAIFHLLKSKRIEDRGDDRRSEFHIRQSQSEKPLSHGTDTLGTRSGHVGEAEVSPETQDPLKVVRDTLAYRQAEDAFSRFAADTGLVFSPALEIQAGELQDLLTEWAAAEGIDPPSKDMGDWLHENGCRQKRKRYTDDSGKRRQRRFWLGVGIEDGNHVQEQTDAL